MTNLCINLVTRGRPEVLLRTIERTLPNISRDDTVFCVSIDEDDAPTIEAVERVHLRSRPGLFVLTAPREDDIGSKYNRMLEYESGVYSKPDVYCNLSDYTAFVTPGFDQKIIDAAKVFPDGIGMVVNPLRNASFSDIYAVTRGLVDKLGFYFPPHFSYWFVDHWIDDIGKLIDRVVMADVKIEYDPVMGKSVTQNVRDVMFWTALFDAGYLERRRTAHAIVDGLDEPDWRKAMIKSRAPLIEFRSRWINDQCRGMAENLQKWSNAGPPDERYKRVKAKAVTLMRQWLADIERQTKAA